MKQMNSYTQHHVITIIHQHTAFQYTYAQLIT